MNKKINTNLGITILLMTAAILVLVDFIVIGHELEYKYYYNKEICDNIDTKNDITTNNYQIFAKKLKEQISSKYSSNNMEYIFVKDSIIENGYNVYLTENGSLFIKYNNDELNEKFGEYKIADQVLSFYVIREGQDIGNNLYFINNDGTVGSADIEYGVLNNGTISIENDLGYKNIVSVVNGGFGLEHSGGAGAIFIDINGNIYNQNLR